MFGDMLEVGLGICEVHIWTWWSNELRWCVSVMVVVVNRENGVLTSRIVAVVVVFIAAKRSLQSWGYN